MGWSVCFTGAIWRKLGRNLEDVPGFTSNFLRPERDKETCERSDMQSLTPTRELTSMCRRAVPPIGRSMCYERRNRTVIIKQMGSNMI